MSYTVTFENYSKSFTVQEDELILDAAVRQGINFPYTCSKGFCGACKGELLSGDIEYKKELISKNIHTKFLKLVQYKMI